MSHLSGVMGKGERANQVRQAYRIVPRDKGKKKKNKTAERIFFFFYEDDDDDNSAASTIQ